MIFKLYAVVVPELLFPSTAFQWQIFTISLDIDFRNFIGNLSISIQIKQIKFAALAKSLSTFIKWELSFLATMRLANGRCGISEFMNCFFHIYTAFNYCSFFFHNNKLDNECRSTSCNCLQDKVEFNTYRRRKSCIHIKY